jgi:hypothetical protein
MELNEIPRGRKESNRTVCSYRNLYSNTEHQNVEFGAAACGADIKLS